MISALYNQNVILRSDLTVRFQTALRRATA